MPVKLTINNNVAKDKHFIVNEHNIYFTHLRKITARTISELCNHSINYFDPLIKKKINLLESCYIQVSEESSFSLLNAIITSLICGVCILYIYMGFHLPFIGFGRRFYGRIPFLTLTFSFFRA